MPSPASVTRIFPFAFAVGLAFSTGCASCRHIEEASAVDDTASNAHEVLSKVVGSDPEILVQVTGNRADTDEDDELAGSLIEDDDALTAPTALDAAVEDEELSPRLRQTGAGDTADNRTDAGREELEVLLGLRPIPPLDITDLLTKVDVVEGLARPIVLHRHVLPGTLPSPYYNNIYFAVDDPESFGLALEVWHFRSSNAARYFYGDMSSSQAVQTQSIGLATDAFYTKRDDLLQVVAFDADLKAVFRLHCDLEGCHVPLLMRFTQQAQTRLRGESPSVP